MKKLMCVLWISAIFAANLNFAEPAEASSVSVVENYFQFLNSGNFEGLLSLFHDDVIWHQPGQNHLSKAYYGKQEVAELFNNFMLISNGSFKIDEVSAIMGNGDLVTALIKFSAHRCNYIGVSMAMAGVDLMRVVDGKIVEVWLFSADQAQEDAFWG